MAAGSLLALIDDIANILDDVAVLSKVAAKQTVGVLGDDLALNAQQVAGVSADRELPVVWAVAKGSFVNKAILIPAALAISAFAPWAVTPLLMVGGAYLCFEGAEKVAHRLLHGKGARQAGGDRPSPAAHTDRSADTSQGNVALPLSLLPAGDGRPWPAQGRSQGNVALPLSLLPTGDGRPWPAQGRSQGNVALPLSLLPTGDGRPWPAQGRSEDTAAVDAAAFERDKVKGAVRTDFVLSAEIIAITLGTVAGAGFPTQLAVLVSIGLVMTIGVYGFVAGIVKLDDAGLYLSQRSSAAARAVGNALLRAAPWLMKLLSLAGTAAMFLVGGGILVHGLPWLHHLVETGVPGWAGWLANAAVGIVAGALVVSVVQATRRLRQASATG